MSERVTPGADALDDDPAAKGAAPTWLLAPLALTAAQRVLEVGTHDGSLTAAMARAGSSITVLEADPARGDAARGRIGGNANVELQQRALSAWLGAGERRRERFDVIVHAESMGSPEMTTADPLAVIDAASELLAEDGTLCLLLRDTSGPTDHDGRDTAEQRPAGSAERRSRLDDALAAHGLHHRRWLVAHPGPPTMRVLFDTGLWARPDGAAVANVLARRAATTWYALTSPLAGAPDAVDSPDPGAAALDAAAEWVLLASPSPTGPHPAERDGLAWIIPAGHGIDRLAGCSELRDDDGTWSLQPLVSGAPDGSGPFRYEPSPSPIPPGESAQDGMERAIVDPGSPDRLETFVRAWWTASAAAMTAAAGPLYRFDYAAGDFVIATDGGWQHVARDIGSAFRLPTPVIAYRGLRLSLRESIIRTGSLGGMDPAATLDEVTRGWLRALDVPCDDTTAYLWAELETDLAVHTGTAGLGRAAYRAALDEETRTPIHSLALLAPSDQLVRSAASGRLARESRAVIHRHAKRALELEQLREQVRDGERRAGALQLQIEVRDREVETLQAELETQHRQLYDAAREVEDMEAYVELVEFRRVYEARTAARIALGPDGQAELEAERDLVAASELFDAEWYRETYPDVADGELDPALHYLLHGIGEARDPGPDFSTRAHVLAHPELAETGQNPLLHATGVEPAGAVLAARDEAPLTSVLRAAASGRGAVELEEARSELEAARSELDARDGELADTRARLDEARELLQLVEFRRVYEARTAARIALGPDGQAELEAERDLVAASELFDAEWYRETYPDVADGELDPALHYLLHGIGEARDPGPDFSTRAHVLAHPELAETGQNPLLHATGVEPAGAVLAAREAGRG